MNADSPERPPYPGRNVEAKDCAAHKQPSCSDIRTALAALLASSALKLSDRNRRFLAFVVQETLAGRGERIKAYSIAVDVFGRSEDFDPATDPIVRIEATRLRAALASYYGSNSNAGLVRISIPPGSYSPTFDAPVDQARSLFYAAISASGLPPEKWSSLMYGFWPCGGLNDAKEEAHA